MATIGPGVACYIVRSRRYPDWIGRIVTVVRRVESAACWDPVTGQVFKASGWVVTAPWLPPATLGWVFRSRCLRPIHGPDVQVDQETADKAPSDRCVLQ